MQRVFEMMKANLNKHELRYLLKKIRVPEDDIQELEQTHSGKDKLQDRIYNGFMLWREQKGSQANLDELIHVLHIVNMDELSQKVKAIKVYSQAMRFWVFKACNDTSLNQLILEYRVTPKSFFMKSVSVWE